MNEYNVCKNINKVFLDKDKLPLIYLCNRKIMVPLFELKSNYCSSKEDAIFEINKQIEELINLFGNDNITLIVRKDICFENIEDQTIATTIIGLASIKEKDGKNVPVVVDKNGKDLFFYTK